LVGRLSAAAGGAENVKKHRAIKFESLEEKEEVQEHDELKNM
jgi:hypothetical protein